MEKVEWDDVQRLVLSGYPKLPFSAYVFWHFVPGEVDAARKWLRRLSDRLTCATAHSDQQAINLALTAHGLQYLRVSDGVLNSFSLEFLEGMAPKPTAETKFPRRSNVLGDVGESSPEVWEWGGWKESRDIDGMLLLYAPDKTKLPKSTQWPERLRQQCGRTANRLLSTAGSMTIAKSTLDLPTEFLSL